MPHIVLRQASQIRLTFFTQPELYADVHVNELFFFLQTSKKYKLFDVFDENYYIIFNKNI